MTIDAQMLRIAAQPDPLTLAVSRTAVLVIDMQNDFGSVGGMFDRAGIDIRPIQAAVAPTARVVRAARAAGMPIIYLKMEHRADLCDAGREGSPHRRKHARMNVGMQVAAPSGEPSGVLVRDTWSTEILPELAPQPNDIIVSKHRYSGFYATDLDLILRSRGIDTLVCTGCTTSVCVESTMRDAMYRDYACLLLTDCTAEPIGHGLPRSNYDASLLVIQLLIGWTATSVDFLAALDAATLPTAA